MILRGKFEQVINKCKRSNRLVVLFIALGAVIYSSNPRSSISKVGFGWANYCIDCKNNYNDFSLQPISNYHIRTKPFLTSKIA